MLISFKMVRTPRSTWLIPSSYFKRGCLNNRQVPACRPCSNTKSSCFQLRLWPILVFCCSSTPFFSFLRRSLTQMQWESASLSTRETSHAHIGSRHSTGLVGTVDVSSLSSMWAYTGQHSKTSRVLTTNNMWGHYNRNYELWKVIILFLHNCYKQWLPPNWHQ